MLALKSEEIIRMSIQEKLNIFLASYVAWKVAVRYCTFPRQTVARDQSRECSFCNQYITTIYVSKTQVDFNLTIVHKTHEAIEANEYRHGFAKMISSSSIRALQYAHTIAQGKPAESARTGE